MIARVLLVAGYALAVVGFGGLVRGRPAQPLRAVAAAELGTGLVAAGWWLLGMRLAAGLNAGFAAGYLVSWWLGGGSRGAETAAR